MKLPLIERQRLQLADGKVGEYVPAPRNIEQQCRRCGQNNSSNRSTPPFSALEQGHSDRGGQQAQHDGDAVLLDIDQGGERQREERQLARSRSLRGEPRERARRKPCGKGDGDGDRGLAIGREVITRHEAGVERRGQQQAEARRAPGWNRRRVVVAALDEAREKKGEGKLQDDVERDHHARRERRGEERCQEGGELQVVRRGGQKRMVRPAVIRREGRMIVEISGVGQQVRESVGEAGPRARHDGEQRQGHRPNARHRSPVGHGEPQPRRDEADHAHYNHPDRRQAQRRRRCHAPQGQHQAGAAPAGDERRLRRPASQRQQPSEAGERQGGGKDARPTGEIGPTGNHKFPWL